MSRNDRRKTLGFERLETRRMLAGDVGFSVANNTLTLTGDNAANAVLITNSSEGVILVKGLVQVAEPVAAGQVAQPTTIGGTSSKFFQNINSIVINFNGGTTTGNKGDDAVVITNVTLSGGVSIHTSDGDDIVALGQFDNSAGLVDAAANSSIGPVGIKNGISINVQTGDNKIVANKVSIQGATGTNLGITGGDGSDSITLTNVSVAHATSINDNGAVNLTIDNFYSNVLATSLGIGNDNVSITHTTINSSASIDANFGNDSLSFDHDVFGSLGLTLGAGNDQLHFLNSTVAQGTSLDAGTGNDMVDFNTVLLKGVNAVLGAGNDQVSIEDSTMAATTLAAGDGADTVGIDNLHASSLAVTGGNGNDTFNFNTVVVANGANIDAGANTDAVTLLHFTSHSLTLSLGAGNDSAWLQDVSVAAGSTVNGGLGNDSVVMLDVHSNTLAASMSNGGDHLSMADLTVHKKTTLGGGNGNDLLSMGDGLSLGTLTRRLFEASNHTVPSPLAGV